MIKVGCDPFPGLRQDEAGLTLAPPSASPDVSPRPTDSAVVGVVSQNR